MPKNQLAKWKRKGFRAFKKKFQNKAFQAFAERFKKDPGPPPDGYPYHLRIALSVAALKESASKVLGVAMCGYTLAGFSLAFGIGNIPGALERALNIDGIRKAPEKIDVKMRYEDPGENWHYMSLFFKDRDLAIRNCQSAIDERDRVMDASYIDLAPNLHLIGYKQFFEKGGAVIPEVYYWEPGAKEGKKIYPEEVSDGQG
jgi:hypothetical protein